MYVKPVLESLGTFRELTQLGFSGRMSDGASIFGLPRVAGRGRGRNDFPSPHSDPTTS